MCKVKTPKMAPLPPERATALMPQRAGILTDVARRLAGPQGGGRGPMVEPPLVAKIGGIPTVLGAPA
jgi:hypothetical protein